MRRCDPGWCERHVCHQRGVLLFRWCPLRGRFVLAQWVDGELPCVVMGHGGSGTKRLGLPKYAEKFTAAGLAVLAFDYRHFGSSGGEPR